jgi:hypothetical protein
MVRLLLVLFIMSMPFSSAQASDAYRTTCSEFTYVNGKKELTCTTKKINTSYRPQQSYMPPPRPHYFNRRGKY